jgi:hypothetical protein
VHVHRALVLAEVTARQGDCHVAAVVAAAASRGWIGQRATPRLLHCPRQAALDADAVECLQFLGRGLQRLLLGLDGFEARDQFGLVFADAVALQCAAQLGILRFQALDTLDQRLDLRQKGLVVDGVRRQGHSAQRQGHGQRSTGRQGDSHAQYPPFLPMPA